MHRSGRYYHTMLLLMLSQWKIQMGQIEILEIQTCHILKAIFIYTRHTSDANYLLNQYKSLNSLKKKKVCRMVELYLQEKGLHMK